MTAARPSNPRHARRAAILLEVVLSVAIFVIAGGAILNLVDGTMSGLEQSRQKARAADLARSAMAKIEAGIETPQTLSGPVERQSDSMQPSGPPSGWELQIDTDASQFRGLTRVTVKAFKRATGRADRIDAQFSLVQLVRLGSKGEDKPGDQDSLSEQAKRGVARQQERGDSAPKPGAEGRGP